MPALNLKGVPAKLYSKLKKSAHENRRSLNNEAIFRLEQAYGFRRQDSSSSVRRKSKAKKS
ncbi:Arc family DNA-binding protein [bacterium]|nr:Arc family DNA-binding protein [bacterium]MCI0605503.1 Arc family DNA-binding protein [bacterium]